MSVSAAFGRRYARGLQPIIIKNQHFTQIKISGIRGDSSIYALAIHTSLVVYVSQDELLANIASTSLGF